MSDQPIFRVTNHHTDSCGLPPTIDDSEPNRYLGYFENESGEQAIFVYDRTRRAGTLSLGDAGWTRSHEVVEGVRLGRSIDPGDAAGVTFDEPDASLAAGSSNLQLSTLLRRARPAVVQAGRVCALKEARARGARALRVWSVWLLPTTGIPRHPVQTRS
jgi:hypothetical protein